jgi:hypothetical protein
MVSDISIEEFAVHVLTSTLKTFFRELPEPLLTFEFYEEFIQASGRPDLKFQDTIQPFLLSSLCVFTFE